MLKKINRLSHPAVRFLSILLLTSLGLTACAQPTPSTTVSSQPAGTTAPAGGQNTITIQGVILTNGTVFVMEAPALYRLTNDMLSIQLPAGSPSYKPGALVEFTIQDAIRESYPPQATAISSRLIKETSSTIIAPINLGPNLQMHLGDAAVLIDVRTPQEFAEGHLAGALNIPLNDIQKVIASQVPDKNKTILLYCRSGNRSATAANQLKKLQYAVVFDLGGVNSFTGDLVK